MTEDKQRKAFLTTFKIYQERIEPYLRDKQVSEPWSMNNHLTHYLESKEYIVMEHSPVSGEAKIEVDKESIHLEDLEKLLKGEEL